MMSPNHLIYCLHRHGQGSPAYTLETIAVLRMTKVTEEEKLLKNTEELENYLGSQLQQLKPGYLSIGSVFGLGLFWTIVLMKNQVKKNVVVSSNREVLKILSFPRFPSVEREKRVRTKR